MPANNHRGTYVVSTGYLNERNNTLAQIAEEMASQGWAGENWNPDDDSYDLAVGPPDRVKRGDRGLSEGDFKQVTQASDRNVKGQN